MTTFDATTRPRLKHHGRRTVVQDRYQRPEVKDLGRKWKIFFWDYIVSPRIKRTKTWMKSEVPTQREAQREADQFMEKINNKNNQPELFKAGEETVRDLYNKCRELTWPHLKNSTRKQYMEHFKTHLLPAFGSRKLSKMSTVELQAYFNSLPSPDRGSKTVSLIHGTFRAALNQGIAWGMLSKNPAISIKLPRKRAVKPPILLPLILIRKVIEMVKEPTRSLLILMVFASMRVGEVLALRWKDILPDRIIVDERVYDDEFDDVKTDAGEREVPFDRHGVILGAIQVVWERNQKFRKPDDLVFANAVGKPFDRHNLHHSRCLLEVMVGGAC